ncbi:MAG: glycosyltransferase family 2 protein [Lachnospiraceae bacterium]|jgi:rhamnosyltransferase|nr:glycosyltransferase family 2 protein [Lachnospiraceae bacterium]
MQEIDVIIPVYRPGKELVELIERLEHQSVPVHRILLVNTEEKYWKAFEYDHPHRKRYENIRLWHISKREFDHGKTRREAVKKSKAGIFVMMTQDAMPADEFLLERLTAPLSQKNMAASYARQLPGDDAGAVERFTRQFNYPPESRIKSAADIPELGIKTYFCSNVCAAYRRDIYERQGGFPKRAIFNEDMIYAAGCIQAGYRIAYTAQAKVIHSHQYTNKVQFRRNFDLGVSQAEHPEIFRGVPSESEGIKLVKRTAVYLRENGKSREILPMCVTSIYKFFGYKLGKNYKRLSFRRIMKYTMNREYWSGMTTEKW